MLHQWSVLVFSLLRTGLVGGCRCPPATVWSEFPSETPATVCCLNFSGSALGQVRWSRLTNQSSLRILDLSDCNITSLEMSGVEASLLEKVYLGRNRMAALPLDFLAGQPRLEEVDLSQNQLEELPEGFLQDSDNLRRLDLQENRLSFLPASVLQRPALQSLQLDGNPWDCSCSFLEVLENSRDTKTGVLASNLTCVSPWKLAGRAVWSVRVNDMCRPASLTALFFTLPLLLLSALVVCWCCGRKRKEAPILGASTKRRSSSPGAGLKGHHGQMSADCRGRDVPASELLGRTANMDGEKEVRLGSMESLQPESRCSDGKPSGTEMDSVSVSEVLKDSADRERAYMTQSTEYYSLVPGIRLDDSDHGE
uniref:trophoblast glycoprotein n=1 Tax=Doryrhamphus excisus TaxID=161450 RepID=UPI0025AEADFE|nr:trophoblast glycoprotein [Doryrhamphus excisus]